MEEKLVVNVENGTKLVPVFDVSSFRPVESIGSYLAPQECRNIDEIASQLNSNSRKLEKLPPIFTVLKTVRSPVLSPRYQRRQVVEKRGHKFHREYLDKSCALCDAVEDEHVPMDHPFVVSIYNACKRFSQEFGQSKISCEEELVGNYLTAAKAAIVEYILSCKQERRRLKVPDEIKAFNWCDQPPIIRGPFAWTASKRVNQKALEEVYILNHETLQAIIDCWHQKFDAFGLFERISFPISLSKFRDAIRENAALLKIKLKKEWVPSVAQLIEQSSEERLQHSSSPSKRLSRIIETLVFLLLRAFVLKTIRKWAAILEKGLSKYSSTLFTLKMFHSSSEEDRIAFDVPMFEWNDVILCPLTEIIKAVEGIPRTGDCPQVEKSFKLVRIIVENDLELVEAKQRITNLFSPFTNRKEFLNIYQPKMEALSKERNLYSVNELRDYVKCFTELEEAFLNDSVSHQKISVFELDLVDYKEQRLKQLQNDKNRIVKQRVEEILNLSRKACASLNVIQRKMDVINSGSKHWWKNMMLLRKYRASIRLVFLDITYVQDHWSFIVEEGAPFVTLADIEKLGELYWWPSVIRHSLEKAEERLAKEKSILETELRERGEKLNANLLSSLESLKRFAKKWMNPTSLEESSKIGLDFNKLSERLSNLESEAKKLNDDQILLGLHPISEFTTLTPILQLRDSLKAFFNTQTAFEVKAEEWETREGLTLERLKEIEDETKSFYATIEKLEFSKADYDCDDDVCRAMKENIERLKSRITSFVKIQLPLLKVMSSPLLQERHWKDLSSLLKVKLTLKSLKQAKTQLDESHVRKAEEIANRAQLEYASQLLLEKMLSQETPIDWSHKDLEMLAENLLGTEPDLDPLTRSKLAQASVYIYEHLTTAFNESGEPNLILPSFFVEFIACVKTLLNQKQSSVKQLKLKYEAGVEKIDELWNWLNGTSEKLTKDYGPELEQLSIETETRMVQVEKESIQAERIREKISADESLANKSTAFAQKIKDESVKELSKAVPAMKAAIQGLNVINPEDITFLRTMKDPPLGIKIVLESVAILLGYGPLVRQVDSGTSQHIQDYWPSALRMLNCCEVDLLKTLQNYDKNRIRRISMSIVRSNYLSLEEFDPERLRSVSIACESLGKWVKAIDIYDRVVNVIKPKRIKLKLSETELTKVMKGLKEKKAQLEAITEALLTLQDEFSLVLKKKVDCEDAMQKLKAKTKRVDGMMKKLTEIKSLWTHFLYALRELQKALPVKAIFTAALVTFLGPFTQADRRKFFQDSATHLSQIFEIGLNSESDLILAQKPYLYPFTWLSSEGFDGRQLSIESAIILFYCRRIPFILDPSEMATKWIKSISESRWLDQADQNQIRDALGNGKPVALKVNEDGILEDKGFQEFIDNVFRWQTKQLESSSSRMPESMGQLYLISDGRKRIPASILNKVVVINWKPESQDNQEILLDLDSFGKTQVEEANRLIQAEGNLLELLSSEKVSLVEDDNLLHLMEDYSRGASKRAANYLESLIADAEK